MEGVYTKNKNFKGGGSPWVVLISLKFNLLAAGEVDISTTQEAQNI